VSVFRSGSVLSIKLSTTLLIGLGVTTGGLKILIGSGSGAGSGVTTKGCEGVITKGSG
jgi:hypothetical protein